MTEPTPAPVAVTEDVIDNVASPAFVLAILTLLAEVCASNDEDAADMLEPLARWASPARENSIRHCRTTVAEIQTFLDAVTAALPDEEA